LIRRVHSYVAYRIGSGADADDVTGEVFARAVRYRSSYDPAVGEPAAWLLGIARRVLADRGSPPTQLLDEQQPEAAGDDSVDALVDRLVLRDAVAGLPENDRELIGLRYGADLTARQIGELTDATTHAVEVALSRALGRLRARLAEPAQEPQQPVR
jgi:RNA polymerase sigma factor (sigma-70 family)